MDEQERASLLLKQATNLKKVDINAAISAIKEAIDLVSDETYSISFKLSSYYHLGGYKEEAYEVLEKALLSVKMENIGAYNMLRASIFDQKRILQKKDKLLIDSLKTNYIVYYNILLGFAFQGGRTLEFENMIKKGISVSDQFDSLISSYIESLLPILREVLIISDKANSDVDLFKNGVGSIGDIYDNHLRSNEVYMNHYFKLNDGLFEKFVDELKFV